MMGINEEQQQNILNQLGDRIGVHPKCPVCGAMDALTVIPDIVAMPEVDERSVSLNKGFLAFPVICENCGFTMLFNAKKYGL